MSEMMEINVTNVLLFIVVNGLVAANVIFFFNHYLGIKYKFSNILSLVILAALTYLTAYILNQIALKAVLNVMCLIVMVFFLYKGSVIKKIFAPVILLALTTLAELLTATLLHITPVEAYGNSSKYIVYGIVANLLILIIDCIVLKLANAKNKSREVTAFYDIFIISLIPFILTICVLRIEKFVEQLWRGSWIYLILILVLWGVIDYLLYCQAVRLKKALKEELVMTGINDYYQRTLHRYIEIKEDSDDYRKIRHDLINYIERIKLEDKHERSDGNKCN